LQDFQECGADPLDRVVVDVEVQPAVGWKAEDCGCSGVEFECELVADEGPGGRSWSDRSGTVDYLVHPAVVTDPHQHDMNA
jgi:hypothetical protein